MDAPETRPHRRGGVEGKKLMLWAKIVAGAMVGAALGLLAGRARLCSSEACHARANVVASVVAGAVFGAAAAYYLLSK